MRLDRQTDREKDVRFARPRNCQCGFYALTRLDISWIKSIARHSNGRQIKSDLMHVPHDALLSRHTRTAMGMQKGMYLATNRRCQDEAIRFFICLFYSRIKWRTHAEFPLDCHLIRHINTLAINSIVLPTPRGVAVLGEKFIKSLT